LLKRKNNQAFAQTRDENRRPIFVIADLDPDDIAGTKYVDFRYEIARSLFNLPKRPGDVPSGIENGGLIAFSR
jgi:hypothetical protein